MFYKNKTIWITGASSGIGKALALAFSKEGANIILSARNEQKLNEVKEQCTNPDKVKILPLDLTDFSSFNEKVISAIQFFNGIDILVNNAGINIRSGMIDMPLEKFKSNVNITITIVLKNAVL